jgi:hypothetical protein
MSMWRISMHGVGSLVLESHLREIVKFIVVLQTDKYWWLLHKLHTPILRWNGVVKSNPIKGTMKSMRVST